jgi:Asp/Glu/hydantoin racemase
MKATVGMLHTSFVFVTVEPMIRDLFRELLPDVKVVDFVDGDLLTTVQREGTISANSVRRMCHLAEAAEDAGVDLIFSACSSLGPAIDVARRLVRVPIVKIDEAMAREAVDRAERIGVLATVPSTLEPTTDLIQALADQARIQVSITSRLCEGAFAILMVGERERHDAMVSEGARALAAEVDLIVLAQASMAPLAARLANETGMEVLASPRMGIQEVARVLAERVQVPATPHPALPNHEARKRSPRGAA